MTTYLLNRASGSLSQRTLEQYHTTALVNALQPSDTRFERAPGPQNEEDIHDTAALVHNGGVNTITIDRFEGRYLLSGGADASVSIWDLEDPVSSSPVTHVPLETLARGAPNAHKNGITAIHFYPFDSGAFTTSSYDHMLKVWSSEGLDLAASFDLDYVIYSHAVSPIADHLLVACASQHPNIRLVDLKSGASTHTLAGHGGAVMAVAWSPKDEHVLVSGGTDGTVRFWDVRRSASHLGRLDMEDNVGIVGYNGNGAGARHRERGQAHNGAVNGLVWTEDGRHLVSTGHDEKIRVWDVISGANTLASFGPLPRNRELRSCMPCLPPANLVQPGKDVLFFPSDKEILMFELFEGKMLKRLRTPGISSLPTAADRSMGKKSRVTELAWRNHSVELYSAHGNGTIRAWKPWTREDAWVEEEEIEQKKLEEEVRQKKRKALEDVYHDITKRRIMI